MITLVNMGFLKLCKKVYFIKGGRRCILLNIVTIRPKRKSIFTGKTVPSGGAEVLWLVCSPADRAVLVRVWHQLM